MIELNINDYITIEEKRELYREAIEFATLKKDGKVKNRTKVRFLKTDTEEETKVKLKYHTDIKYLGNAGERLFINYIKKEIGYIIHNEIYEKSNGFKYDIDTKTPDGLCGDIKTSFYDSMWISKSDVDNNDFFIKVKIDKLNKMFTICGFVTKQYILDNIIPELKSDGDKRFLVKKEHYNTDIEQLKIMYIKK